MPLYTPDLETFKQLATEYNLIPVYREITADLETPVSAYLKVARGPYSFLFESVEGGENLARFSFIGTEPGELIRTGPGEQDGAVDPLNLLRDRMAGIKHANVRGLPKFHGGAVGYIAYDAVSYFEPRVPPISSEKTGLNVPEAIFLFTDSLLIFDHVRHTITVLAYAESGGGDSEAEYTKATRRIEELITRLEQPLRESVHRRASPATGGFSASEANLDYSASAAAVTAHAGEPKTGQPFIPNMTRDYYNRMIETSRRYIFEGEIIQAVVSQRLARRTPVQPFDLYRSLRAVNPSPYMFFLDLDGFQIIGASPELLASVIDGEVAVHPIAGTRPRGKTPEEDDALERELLADEKEVAEHVMLLDLGRNDVGRVSVPGSVRVEQQLEVEKYSHVMHIVSHVTGRLAKGFDTFDALKAAFPAGTVSGAPKVRAMEVIAELEPQKRGPYSGAVGYFSYTGNMDTAIALRTLVLKDGVAYLQAGGGIVADSVPQTEYEETLHKMGALMRAIDHAEESFVAAG
ncbi:MAG: anthranilate synthase component I [Chloroflexi bacterium]|nr:anthranilate synthase component I [Chloroflexota bacterium]MDA1296781.1 anthranilate synthase component I [Chloroflexota bacterium]